MKRDVIGVLARALVARAEYSVMGFGSRVLTLLFLSSRRPGVQSELGALQIRATKRAHTARIVCEEATAEYQKMRAA